MGEFLLNHLWAADLAKSSIMMELLQFLQERRKIDEIVERFKELSEDDIAEALYVLKEIGVVSGEGDEVWLSETGKKFLEAYHETF